MQTEAKEESAMLPAPSYVQGAGDFWSQPSREHSVAPDRLPQELREVGVVDDMSGGSDGHGVYFEEREGGGGEMAGQVSDEHGSARDVSPRSGPCTPCKV
jgi:hypothetical protein